MSEERTSGGSWTVDRVSRPGILVLTLVGRIGPREMESFVAEHNAAVDAYRGRPYRVFCDISRMQALDPEAAELLEGAKRHSAAQTSFQGSAVLVASATVALQHRRTSTRGGVMETELISSDRAALERHLETVARHPEHEHEVTSGRALRRTGRL